MKTKRILVPIEGSPHTSPALGPALDIAKQNDSQLLALHVIPMTFAIGWNYEEIRKIIKERKSKPLLDTVEDWCKRRGVTVKKIIESGNPTEKILEVARREGVDLIVMGAPNGRFNIFSPVRSVIEKACCPVLTIGIDSRRSPCKTWNISGAVGVKCSYCTYPGICSGGPS
jgi:nucleotide-binding universal stress UspA family protein